MNYDGDCPVSLVGFCISFRLRDPHIFLGCTLLRRSPFSKVIECSQGAGLVFGELRPNGIQLSITFPQVAVYLLYTLLCLVKTGVALLQTGVCGGVCSSA